MKLKDWLQKTFDAAAIRSDDVAALVGASALSELEIPDTAVAKFNDVYLTRDRAKNDSEIVLEISNKAKADVYDNTDRLIQPLLKVLSPDKAKEIGSIQKTYKRIEALTEAIPEAIKTATTRVSEDVQKVEAEWSAKTKEIEKKAKEELEGTITKHKNEKLLKTLERDLAGYKFADGFEKMRKTVVSMIIADLKNHKIEGTPIVLEQDDEDNVHVRKNVDGTLRDFYVKDQKLTTKQLLDQYAEPFIVKSNGNGSDVDNGGGDSNGRKNPKQDIDTKNMTLEQIRQLEFGQN